MLLALKKHEGGVIVERTLGWAFPRVSYGWEKCHSP
jgi:hypothetical protein